MELVQCTSWSTNKRLCELVVRFIVQFLCFFLVLLFMMLMMFNATFYAFISMAVCTIFHIRSERSCSLVKKKRTWTALHLVCVQRITIETMQFCCSIGRLYGPILTIFLACNIPLNTTIMVELVAYGHKYPWMFRGIMVTIFTGQCINSIAIHYIAAQVTGLIHSPYKQFMSTSLAIRHVPLIVRLRLTNHVQAFHTKKPYGFSYSIFGLISFQKLFKVRSSLICSNAKLLNSFSLFSLCFFTANF